MKIYTKTGDRGATSLLGGKMVRKDSQRVTACGEVDELNSLLGVIIAETQNKDLIQKLTRVQNELFVLQTVLASSFDLTIKIPKINAAHTLRLEREIDVCEKSLPNLKNFILPGGGETGSKLHLARTVARRAERSIVTLASTERISKHVLSYINRLSDWLFVLARFVNFQENAKEIIWKGRSK